MTATTKTKGRASKNAQALGVSGKGRDIALAIWQILVGAARRITLALMMGCIMTGASTAGEVPSLAGRWIVTALQEGIVPAKGSMFDFTRCGEAWCGIEINKDGKCGRQAFHLATVNETAPEYELKGQFSASDQTKPFTIFASTSDVETGKILWIGGHIGDTNPFERSFPLEVEMSRQGDAVCKADAKTS